MTENAQTTGTKSNSRAGITSVAVVLAMILAVLFLLPGFVAAWFSKTGVTVYMINERYWGIGQQSLTGNAKEQAAWVILYPAFYLVQHSEMMWKIYDWEFRKAGGLALEIDS